MAILFTGRKADLTPSLKDFAEEKLAKLERFLGGSADIHVVLTREKHRHVVEIVARSPHTSLTATADAADFRESIAQCLERALAQARKRHDKVALGRKRRGRTGGRAARAAATSPDGAADDERPVLVPMGRVPVKPMSVEEALFEMQDSPDTFLVFRNADSQRISVIFRRGDGRFGLIEPEA